MVLLLLIANCLLFARIHISSKAPAVICSFVCFIDLLPLSRLASLVHCVISCHLIVLPNFLLRSVALSNMCLIPLCVCVCVCVCVNVRFVFPAGPLVQPGQEEREENPVRPATDSVAAQSIIQSALSFPSILFFFPPN